MPSKCPRVLYVHFACGNGVLESFKAIASITEPSIISKTWGHLVLNGQDYVFSNNMAWRPEAVVALSKLLEPGGETGVFTFLQLRYTRQFSSCLCCDELMTLQNVSITLLDRIEDRLFSLRGSKRLLRCSINILK